DLTIALQGPAGRYPGDADTLAVVQVMLNDIGVNTTLESLEWSAYNSRIWGADNVENIALIGLANSLFDGWFALRALPCDGAYAKRTNWCNPEFDQLLADAEFNLDLEERARQIEAAYDIVAEERPMIALFQIDALVGVSNAIDWQPRPDEMVAAFDIQAECGSGGAAGERRPHPHLHACRSRPPRSADGPDPLRGRDDHLRAPAP